MIDIRQKFSILLITVLILGFVGCKSSEKTAVPDEELTVSPDDTKMTDEFRALLDNTRSSLSDLHMTQIQDIPDTFLQNDGSETSITRNPYDGYRVQILSTHNVARADSVANQFRMWADSTIAGYQAKAYVSFRQPYYKVHIGDFQQRDKANQFSRLIKKEYPDAWVVHDRIEPSATPADTAKFEFQKPEPFKSDTPKNN